MASLAQAQDTRKREMTICLVGGAIGVEANQLEAIELAARHGFESVEARPHELVELSDDELGNVLARLKTANLQWGTAGLPVDFRRTEEAFQAGLQELPKLAAGLRRAGVKRVATYLLPSHRELTYLQNHQLHAKRLREICKILSDHGLRLGLEYVGTQALLTRSKYAFVRTLAETLELCDTIGTGNAGVVLDSWHWWTAGDSAEAIAQLKNDQVVLVDLNDAPKGIDKADQQDGSRQLPMATGVIPIKPFLEALVAIGYDGPVRAEPFNQTLRDLDNDPACEATIQSMRKAFALIGG